MWNGNQIVISGEFAELESPIVSDSSPFCTSRPPLRSALAAKNRRLHSTKGALEGLSAGGDGMNRRETGKRQLKIDLAGDLAGDVAVGFDDECLGFGV